MLQCPRHGRPAFLATVGLLLFATSASAASSVTATANATILSALSLVQDVQLNFGRIVSGTSAGTATVTQAGTETCTVVTCLNDGVAGQFTVTGTALSVVVITAAANATLTGPAGSAPMTASITAPATTVIGAGGSQNFNTGGTLPVAANQAAGAYSGTYTVSVAYQ